MSDGPSTVTVEIAFASLREQVVLSCRVEAGLSLRTVVEQSGIHERFPEIDLEHAPLGVFGKLRNGTEMVRDGERIEIYRPLAIDPKKRRRERARRP